MEVKKALEELRKEKERKFDQSIDLVVNLKGVDIRKENISLVINAPNKIKDKKVCGFFTKKSDLVDTITKPEFDKYKDKGALKELVEKYDFFIAAAPLMPSVATTFGKVLGPAGKMPSPQLGIIPPTEDPKAIQETLDRIATSIKVRAKEPSIKLSVGKASMKDEELLANIKAIYDGILNALPTKNENIKNVMLKLSMSKPIKVEM